MELELKKERFACYRALPPLTDTHEETSETIVPDYLPDIARVVDVSGCLFLRGSEITDGRVSVSGTIRMTLLYMPEDAQGLKAFEYSLPLDCTLEGRLSETVTESCLEGHICASDVKVLNPRKFFTRVSVELSLTPYAPYTLTVCSGVEEQERYQIETLCERREITTLRAVKEKDFTVSDELPLSGAKEPIRELLRTRCCALRVTDCKVLGSKLVLKGLAELETLYLDASGGIAQMSGELPFSQVMDGLALDEGEVTARAVLRLTGVELRVGSESEPDNDRLLSARLSVSAFAMLREQRSICCVADLYSTTCDLNAKTENTELCGDPVLLQREQSVRERIETGTEVRSVLSTEVRFCGTGISGSGSGAELHTAVNLRVLYLDENGAPMLSERRVEVLLKTDLPDTGRAAVRDVSAGDIAISLGADGVELRFPVIFTVAVADAPCYPCLLSLQAEKRTDKGEDAPSLVLRAMKQGERLWDIAKQYRTTVDDILAANELAEETAAVIGRLLLIPRKR